MPSCSLSPAERAVTDLLVQGLSNQAIADALVLSVRTVESHVSHSLVKTGCTSRLELVVWLLGQQQLQS
ncbi:MAG: transcriptional regulator [Synechococcus sp. TMED187]|jgi:DNA-binding NarL/FixJ family response regulator|uniref:response regulator transcription factor n=1 Tax=unclassified Synechococcus TaxID=2626047 RepID=UPI000B6AB0F4|nr:helix-turn-helix transcriptional regulator [Synechococcus sp. UW105]MAS28509.1 transcriptional regulator [Synechococcus sp. NAT40]OUW48798.1 MAG: transcriptional regulator [Synechococcus sp. TMED187]RZO12026.1 MAG: LuxR family transcriptional regulator [Synechococcus sp. MED-G135]|tara:strand:+ start:249 stop:455 length:207 start_codon:yes stop_codon:yes gene_type:complete